MKYIDLHTQFINAINDKIPKKTDLVNRIADILHIEKDAAYRRLSGKVNFSVREMGLVTDHLDISLDKLMRRDEEYLWLPFIMESPLKMRSMESLFDVIDHCIEQLSIVIWEPAESGNIYNTLPIEFYLHSPVLTKYFFFRWGHFFVGSTEFDNYSTWELPQRALDLIERLKNAFNFNKIYYIWDESLIWMQCKEIDNMHKMGVISTENKDEMKLALKELLSRMEQALNGICVPSIPFNIETTSFYVSPLPLGFTSNYFFSGRDRHFITLQTFFSFCLIDKEDEIFHRLKNWTDSFKGISTLLSHSGRIERKIFFDKQQKIVDYFLDK